jgi:hypothetical protein
MKHACEATAVGGRTVPFKGRAMRNTKVNVVVSAVFAVCLAGLIVAHIDLRRETIHLRRAVRLAAPDSTDTAKVSPEIEQDIKRLDSELREVKRLVDQVRANVDRRSFEVLKDEVGSLRASVSDARALIRKITDSSDLVRRFELDRTILDLEKRVKTVEEALGRR